MIKGSIQQGDIMITNVYAPNSGTPNFIKQTLLNQKEEIGSSTIITNISSSHFHRWTDLPDRKSKKH